MELPQDMSVDKKAVGERSLKTEYLVPVSTTETPEDAGFIEAPRFEVDIKCEVLPHRVVLPPARPVTPDCILPDSTVEDEPIQSNSTTEEVAEDQETREVSGGQPSISQFFVNLTEDLMVQCRLLDGTYRCPMCQKHIIKKDSLKRHIKTHERPTYSCTFCGRVFHQEEYYKKHMATHTGERLYDCDECDKKFKSTSNLSQHKKGVHAKAKEFTCEICNRSFSIHSHLVRHTGGRRCKKPTDKPLQCDVCQKTFEKKFLLKSHLRRHSTERPFKCDYCGMDFKYKVTIERHIFMHQGIKNFVCNICNKSYTHAALLRIHLRRHTGEKPFKCAVCNKVFAHKCNLKRHLVRHEKPKQTTCTICNKKFPRESRLIYHMRSHTKEQPFPCKVCPKKFTHKQNVLRHYQRKHPNHVYECTETDASVAKTLWKDIQDNQIRVIKKRIHERNFKEERRLRKAATPEVVHIKTEEFAEAINNAESIEVINNGDGNLNLEDVTVKQENLDSENDEH